MVQCERKNTHGLCCYHACASAIGSIMAPTSPGQVCIMALKVSPNRVGGRYFVISSYCTRTKCNGQQNVRV